MFDCSFVCLFVCWKGFSFSGSLKENLVHERDYCSNGQDRLYIDLTPSALGNDN